jgi:hypothetical protein
MHFSSSIYEQKASGVFSSSIVEQLMVGAQVGEAIRLPKANFIV